jgi:hypothetical protein
MKLPKKVLDKVKEKESFIRQEVSGDYFEWISNPDTELLRPDDYKRVIEILHKAPD